MYDVIIVGMGPAGLTAAVYAGRKKMSALLIGKHYGGQAAWASEIENYMGFHYVTGTELMQKFREQAERYPVEQKQGEVATVGRGGGGFTVRMKSGEEFMARSLIIASGKFPRRLNVPGEARLTNKGVSYCSVCDGPLFEGLDVAVVGGGNSALEAAHDLVKIAKKVYVVSLGRWEADPILMDRVKGNPGVEQLVGWETVEIEGGQLVSGLKLRSVARPDEVKRLDVQGVFVKIGTIPGTRLVEGFLELNEEKEIVVGCDATTSVPGVFAAGDATNIPDKQVIVSAGEGAKAALGAYRYILTC
ncbi:MAG: FAD-dependent oxidoreductase [Bacillota bacterium]|jgi:alkyl hydroperoxide reductase subunit F